ncbi:putative glycoside-hydrolase family GH114 protein [Elsinoe australis]|uniref:alpha-galactosidase n=1 Tax=Elsinoe australis TaxID=40998 RepID=A0A4U7ARE3_9PEZI|nr:putative glycoside-hydrolase family GH114 protein [Elsinoe australis]
MLSLTFLLFGGLVAAAPAKKVWQPAAGTSWQIVLDEKCAATTALAVDVQAYDLDLFDTDVATINALHAKGKKVMCYFSAGSYEPYRPDSKQFKSDDMGSVMEGWEDEKWLKTNSANVRKIMAARIALAATKGCDAIDPDNVDGYSNTNGIGLKQADAVNYVQWMSQQATSKGMSIGLKNAGDLVPKVMSSVHFSVNEQCHQYNECAKFQPFIKANKPVFNIEYPGSINTKAKVAGTNKYCNSASTKSAGFSTILKNMDLDVNVNLCPASANYSQSPAPSYGNAPQAASSQAPSSASAAPASKPSATKAAPAPAKTTTAAPKKKPAPTPTPHGDDDDEGDDDDGDDDDDDN